MYTYHLVDRFHDRKHLIICDLAIAVDVVQLKRPVQLVLHPAPRGHRQRAYELLEINHAAIVRIKNTENIIRERRWVAKREELPIDLLELLLGQGPGRTVLEESYDAVSGVNHENACLARCAAHLCTIAVALSCQNEWLSGAPRVGWGRASTVWSKCQRGDNGSRESRSIKTRSKH